MVNVCVAGAGYWGKNLVRTFHELRALYGVCDVNPATLRACEEPYPEARLFPCIEQALEDDRIDALVIAAPAGLHYELAKRALEARKHVFCEKPLALCVSEGQMLCELAEKTGRVLMVGHLLEYHPAVEALQAMAAQGTLGDLWYAYSNRLKFGRFRAEENVLWSFAPHDISIMNAVLGQAPNRVDAFARSCLTEGVADFALARFEYAGGLRAHVFTNWLNPVPERKFVVIGSKRMAVFDDLAVGTKLRLFDTNIRWENSLPVAQPLQGEDVETPGEPPLRAECRHFLECIEQERRPRTDGNSALRVLRVLQACQDSLANNGDAVTVPVPGGRTGAV